MKGILLINLGSPKDLEDESIKEYLKEFLSDDLVVDYPKANPTDTSKLDNSS